MDELAGMRFAEDGADTIEAAPEVVEKIVEEIQDNVEGAEEGVKPEGQEEAKPEEPKAWKKGPPETVPYKVLSERTEKFRTREAELVAQIDALQSGRTVPSEQLQAPTQPQPIDGMPPKPKAEDFDTYEAYEDAKDEWLQQAGESRAIARLNATMAERAAQTEAQREVDAFETRMQEARVADPEVAEIEEFLLPAAPHLHPAIRQALLSSENPAPMLRHLAESGQSLQEIVQRANSNPIATIMALGKYAGPAAKVATSAPTLPSVEATRTVTGARGFKSQDPVDSALAKMGMKFS